jgi:hypothetical protein
VNFISFQVAIPRMNSTLKLFAFQNMKYMNYITQKANFGLFCWMLEISCAQHRRDIIVVMHKVTRTS